MYSGSAALGEISFAHGPRQLFAQYFAYADTKMRDLGLRLTINTEFHRLVALNIQHLDSWSPLPPIFNPRYSTLSRDVAFWVEAANEFGETIATNAIRVYDHGDRSVAADLRSLRLFYDDPIPHCAAGERVEVTARSADYICGRAVYSGAMWVRPDYRRHGLSRIIPRLARSYALAQWNAPVFWGGVEPDLDRLGVTRAYGSWHVEDGVFVHMPNWRGELHFLFLTMGQATLVRDIVDALQSATDNSRRSDAPMTNISSPRRQGMSIRS